MEIPYTIEGCCPLCERRLRPTDWHHLYDFRVCRKCCYSLANRRQVAFLIDVGVLWGLSSGLDVALGGFIGLAGGSYFLLTPLFVLKDGFGGQSPGKWLMDLKVLRRDTQEPIGIGASILRNLPILGLDVLQWVGLTAAMNSMLLIPSILVVIAKPTLLLIMAFQLNRGPRWGDGLAGTKVIRTSLAYRPPFDIRGVRCVSCGYDLTGNVSGVCPECGTPVSKLSPMNWHVKRERRDQLSVTVARSQDHFADRG